MEKLKIETVGQFLVALEEGPLYNEEGYMTALVNQSEVVVEHAEKTVSHFCMRPLFDVIRDKEFTRQKPIPDKALVWCWDDDWKTRRDIRFYDATNERTFSVKGDRNGSRYNNVEVIEPNKHGVYEEPFAWANEAKKQLED